MNNQVVMTGEQMLGIACKEVMENLPYFQNKDFAPKNMSECADEILALLEKDWLSWDWIKSVCEASISDRHIYIDLDNDWKWIFLSGLNKKKNTRDEFLKHTSNLYEKISKHGVKLEKKNKWGKRYF